MRLNLTQHQSTPEQECFEPRDKASIQRLLTVEALPTKEGILERAAALANAAWHEFPRICGYCHAVNCEHAAGNEPICGYVGGEPEFAEAMIGGAPWLMAPLEHALDSVGIRPIYAFSVRESADQRQPDGSVRKVAVFRHIGFVSAVLER